MKHFFFILLLCGLVGLSILFYERNKAYSETSGFKMSDEFVQLSDSGFVLGNKPFFPVTLNYMVSLMYNDSSMWPCVYPDYEINDKIRFTNKDSCYNELLNQLILIRDLGFNSVRVVHIGEPSLLYKSNDQIGFKAIRSDTTPQIIGLDSIEDYQKYFDAIEILMKAVKGAGLKCIFAVRLFPSSTAGDVHFKKLATHFQDEPVIMAYDFLNEPLYFDSLWHSKQEIFMITSHWQNLRKKYAPGQLSTIGMASQREMFEWDPELVQCDFLSFHPYEYEPDQVRNEIYWYSRFVKKPWMLGETGLSSDNDSVPYEQQVTFADKTLKQLFNCGGYGYSWWQYSDVDWHIFQTDYLGILERRDSTLNSKGIFVHGTPKPVKSVFKNFNSTLVKGKCECPPNYYNFSSNKDFRIIGRLTDESGNPLETGAILAWDGPWINHYFSTSKPDGSFEIYSNYKFFHWMVTALKYETKRNDCNFDTAKIVNGIPTINLGTISLKTVF